MIVTIELPDDWTIEARRGILAGVGAREALRVVYQAVIAALKEGKEA